MYGNARADAQADVGRFLVRVVRTEVEGQQGSEGVPPFYGASALSGPGDIPTLQATITSTKVTFSAAVRRCVAHTPESSFQAC